MSWYILYNEYNILILKIPFFEKRNGKNYNLFQHGLYRYVAFNK